MKIRTRLGLTISAIVAAAMAAAGVSIVRIQGSYLKSDQDQQVQVLENSLRRACLSDLLDRDDLQLVSYVNFLKTQYPALSRAKIVWSSAKGHREVELGSPLAPGREELRTVEVSDPLDPSREITVRLCVDRGALKRALAAARRRLVRVIAAIAMAISLLGVLVSYAISRRVAAPLEALGRAARQIGDGQSGQRIPWQSDDEIGAFVGAFNDMSERLAKLDRAKKLFISSVTHELRSPLGAIESMLDLLGERLAALPEGLRGQAKEYLERIHGNVERLEGFVSDMLDAAKVEMGALECVLKPARVEGVARDVIDFFEARAGQQGVRLDLELRPGMPEALADAGRIRQVLVNLVSNALKFTPRGGRVWIEAGPHEGGREPLIDVAVSDTGAGIPPGDIPGLFRAFSQGSNESHPDAGAARGTGLGLYLVKSIVESHGGRVAISSAPGKGTRVFFTLKAA